MHASKLILTLLGWAALCTFVFLTHVYGFQLAWEHSGGNIQPLF